jgi:hypothetical protein
MIVAGSTAFTRKVQGKVAIVHHAFSVAETTHDDPWIVGVVTGNRKTSALKSSSPTFATRPLNPLELQLSPRSLSQNASVTCNIAIFPLLFVVFRSGTIAGRGVKGHCIERILILILIIGVDLCFGNRRNHCRIEEVPLVSDRRSRSGLSSGDAASIVGQ